MPVLEVTQLRLKGVAADDPALLQALSAVRAKLHTGSQFYGCVEYPMFIYILGIWPSLDAHKDFLASPSKEEVLGPQEDMLQFCWTVHVDMGSMDLLPLDAPILAIERIRVSKDCTQTFQQAIEKYAQELQASHPFKVAHGRICDGAKGHEVLVFNGWKTAQDYVSFSVKGSQDAQYELLQLICARNLEHGPD